MKLDIVAKDYNVTERLREILEAKLSKLDKYFGEEQVNVKAVLTDNGKHCKMEISLMYNGAMIRSEVIGKTMYYNIDECMPKIERQIVKFREKIKDKIKHVDDNYLYVSDVDTAPNKITKVKNFVLQAMTAEDAADQMDMVDHDFYLFINSDNNNVEIVYRRNNGTIGHLQPE